MSYSLLDRIPSIWIALVLGGFCAWLYLRYTKRNNPVSDYVKDRISGTVLVYIFFSRFLSGLLFHPSLSLRDDIFSMLGGAPTNGWLVALAAAVIYVLYGLRKANLLGRKALAILAEVVICGGIPFFAYLAAVDLYPFRWEDIARCAVLLMLLLTVRRLSERVESQPQRLWVVFGGMLLITSVIVPHFDTIVGFSMSQWLFIAVIVTSLTGEALADMKGAAKDSLELNPPVYGQIHQDFNEHEDALNYPNHSGIDHSDKHDAH